MQLKIASLLTLLLAGCNSAPRADEFAATNAQAHPSFSQCEPEVEFQVIALQFASAPEIAEVVEELVQAASRTAVGAGPLYQSESTQRDSEIRVLADTRTNSLLVMAPKAVAQQIEELIAALDVEIQK